MTKYNKTINSQPEYDVVIINFNGEKIISECLKSIYSSDLLPNKIIIYDNHSSDNSLEVIKKNFPDVLLIEGSVNLGFGTANNRAVEHSQAEYILFMNNDLLLDQKCVRELLKGFKDKKIAITNPLIYKGWEKVKNQTLYAFGATINRSGFNYGLYDMGPDRDDLSCFSGACFMARADIFKKIGGFDENFFLYYEEPEISAKLLKNNWKIGRTSAAKCYHLESYSSPKKNTDGIAFRQFYGVQNRWYILGKHWPGRLLLGALIMNLLHLCYITYFYLRYGEFAYLSLWYYAPSKFIKGLKNRDKIKPTDRKWFYRLDSLSLANYMKLAKKVFAKS